MSSLQSAPVGTVCATVYDFVDTSESPGNLDVHWFIFRRLQARLTVGRRGAIGDRNNTIHSSIGLQNLSRDGDTNRGAIVGSRKYQTAKGIHESECDSSTHLPGGNASINNEFRHLANSVERNQYEDIVFWPPFKIDRDLTAGVVVIIKIRKRNLNVVVGCGWLTCSEYTPERTPGDLLQCSHARFCEKWSSKITTAGIAIWCIRRECKSGLDTRIPLREK